MYSFTFEHIASIREIDFSQNLIWVLHADKTPPHIGFSADQLFYSLKANGKDEAIPVRKMTELINRKKIPTLLIQLKSRLESEIVNTVFSTYQTAEFGKTTCLTPITQLLQQSEVNQLSELLTSIQPEISIVAGTHLPEKYTMLPSYSLEDIHDYIQQLTQHVE